MILNHLTDEQRQEMSLIELAYHILDEKKEVMPFKDLTTVMSEFKGMSPTEMQERLVQFYTDLNTAGTFISLGHNTWGLRDWYPLDAIDEEVQELAKPKKRRKKAAVAEVDEIEDEDDDVRVEATAETGARTAFWGAPRAPMTLAISEDGGRSWPYLRNLETGDGYCMTNNSQQKLNREFSYPSIKQGLNGELHIAFTYYRQAIKYVCVEESWVKG